MPGSHNVVVMAKIYFILALIVQSSLIYANIDDNEEETVNRTVLQSKIEIDDYEDETANRTVLHSKPKIDDDVVKDFHEAKKDWMDLFLASNNPVYPTSSAALMAQVTNSEKSAEEQLEDIKEMAEKITLCIQSEMANLLAFALTNNAINDIDENGLRKKRSVETPMASTELVMRLLKHIKSNNEYQNIAIEKMMTAQEIADKYGIEFNPDPEVLSDLAVAANEQTKELSTILQEACDIKNVTDQIEFIPLQQEMCTIEENPADNNTYYVYSVHYPHQEQQHEVISQQNRCLPHEYTPEQHHNIQPAVNHVTYSEYPYHYHYETQMMPPPVQQHYCPPVTQKPNYYESMMAFTPAPEYYPPYCPMEPITTTTTIILPIEELEPEPVLVGEEYEETVSSKVTVDHSEEPGTATVNHVMTYTLSEKSHFKTPEIQNLPQQMQYTFFLM